MSKEQLFIIHYSSFIKFGGVAQLGEHLPCKQGVDSSILFISTSGESPQTKRVVKFEETQS